MSKPRYGWWSYVQDMIRRYPSVRGQDVSGIALNEKEAVEAAIEITSNLKGGKDHLELIDLVLFRGSHTLRGAAMKVHVSYATAKRWKKAFVVATAKNFKCDGLL